MKRKDENGLLPTDAPKKKRELNKSDLVMLFGFLGTTVVAVTVYRFFLQGPYFAIVLGIYLALGAASAIGYVIYNRGFSRKGVTPDMLPPEWSDEKKAAFVADGERRLKRSRWLLIFAFAICFTLALDMIELYVIPTLKGIFGGGK